MPGTQDPWYAPFRKAVRQAFTPGQPGLAPTEGSFVFHDGHSQCSVSRLGPLLPTPDKCLSLAKSLPGVPDFGG